MTKTKEKLTRKKKVQLTLGQDKEVKIEDYFMPINKVLGLEKQ